MNRNLLLAGAVGTVALSAGLGWFFGSQIKSPAEAAAEAEPPPASNITVEVVSTVLSADVVTRGDVVYDEPVEVSLSGSFAEQPARLVVTQSAEPGVELGEGDVTVEVVGRPVFLLTGEVPMYRDLRPGATGDDVRQLEEALARLGHFAGEPDGLWDEATGVGVAGLYEASGYRAAGLSDEDEAALMGARDQVRAAEIAVADSSAALSQAGEGASQSAILAAEGEVEAAEDALDLAVLDAQWANEDAQAAVTDAEKALADAQQALADGENANPPLKLEELAELENAVVVAEEELATANRQVERVAAEQAALVEQAETRLEVAKVSLQELRSGPDTSALSRQVELAREELVSAQEDLADLEAELGTWLPAGELVFLPSVPVRVDQVSATRGAEISGPFMTVTGSAVTVRSSVSVSEADLLEGGMAVQIDNPESEGGFISGTIISVAEQPGTNGVQPDRVYVEVAPDELPEGLVGQNLRLTIPVSSTDGDVLAVPAAALYATADGSTRVEIEDDDGSVRTVTVETGLAADGLVEVTPVDGDMAAGALVIVGADGSTPGGNQATDPVDGS